MQRSKCTLSNCNMCLLLHVRAMFIPILFAEQRPFSNCCSSGWQDLGTQQAFRAPGDDAEPVAACCCMMVQQGAALQQC
jgi:hypothetical protein